MCRAWRLQRTVCPGMRKAGQGCMGSSVSGGLGLPPAEVSETCQVEGGVWLKQISPLELSRVLGEVSAEAHSFSSRKG